MYDLSNKLSSVWIRGRELHSPKTHESFHRHRTWHNIICRNELLFGWRTCVGTKGVAPRMNDANEKSLYLDEMVCLTVLFSSTN